MIALTTNVKLIIAGLALASTAGLTYKITAWRYDARISKMVLEAAQAEAKAVEKVRGEERGIASRYEKALNVALELNKTLQVTAAAARNQRDGLQRTLSEAERRFTSSSQAALIEYSTTLSAVHGECSKRYTGLAEKADGHRIDVETLINAWPAWSEPVK